ncbi:preprotein translocase subunit SecE [Candidatus Berkelbacteria bacterium CG10_big_fil_rev_8_21_14_0_10_41_12]|uniref:Protein translocase subunit SecE n=1 Tax=Candidatus Berkelbacteria bacterium CG10_big_fil_rev_8_21_14_0_10_41_12 TaxID=1974513 RepID=A0A2M6WXQ7_9BACT|nr:MAG: preprotein translocase subunit SecE [Candidatus Berkelbacteria bacterium CG10_big_fil_rev_8_21_14_0_10_41_12]
MLKFLKEYFQSVIAESRKIVWPNRDVLLRDSATVVVFLVVSGLIVAAVDGFFTKLFEYALSKIS